MAQRPIWRGHLRLALVSCPVALIARIARITIADAALQPDQPRHREPDPAADGGCGDRRGGRAARFDEGLRVQSKNRYLLLSDEDIDSVRVPSSTTMTVEKFVPVGTLDPIYFDASYYLVPDGDAGEDVYAVLRDAIAASGTVALTHVVIARRERVVAIVPVAAKLIG